MASVSLGSIFAFAAFFYGTLKIVAWPVGGGIFALLKFLDEAFYKHYFIAYRIMSLSFFS